MDILCPMPSVCILPNRPCELCTRLAVGQEITADPSESSFFRVEPLFWGTAAGVPLLSATIYLSGSSRERMLAASKAMELSIGVLLILDKEGVPFKRIWPSP